MSFKNIADYRNFNFEVARKTFKGQIDTIHVSAYQLENAINTETDVWANATSLSWLDAETTFSVVSTDATDTDGGVGAQTVIIVGLDYGLNQISESVTLSGTTPVTTVNSYFRIQRSIVNLCGTYSGTNVGDITITATSDSSVQAILPAATGRSAKSHYTVPKDKTLLLSTVSMVSESTKPATFRFYIKGALPSTGGLYGGKQLGLIYSSIVGGYTEDVSYEILLPAGIDLWATVEPAAINTRVSLNYQGVVINI